MYIKQNENILVSEFLVSEPVFRESYRNSIEDLYIYILIHFNFQGTLVKL